MTPLYFSPSSIVAVFNAALTTLEETRIIQVRGIFKKSGTSNYGGNYYNRLKDEASDNTVTLITSALLHYKLEDNKTIEFNGYITRRLDKNGRIEIIVNLIELISQQVNKFSEDDTKKIELINAKIENGFKDLDAHIKQGIFNNERISVKIIMGRNGIIDTDINKAMESVVQVYDIEYCKISLSSTEQIIEAIKALDSEGADVICVARGGGENLDIFDNFDVCESILETFTIIASAIGHAQNVTLFEKLADKKFITPTHFGNYLKEIYNSTIEEFEQSKAKLIQDVTNNLKLQYDKQIENLKEQLKTTTQLHEQSSLSVKNNYVEQVKNLQQQQEQKDLLIQQANMLATNYQKQLDVQTKTGISTTLIVVIIVIAIIIGIVIGSFIQTHR